MKEILKKYNFSKKVVSNKFTNHTEYENNIIKAFYMKRPNEHISVCFKNEQKARIHQNAFYQIIAKSIFDAEKVFFNGFYVLVTNHFSYIREDEFLESIGKAFDEFYALITPTKEVQYASK